MFRARLAGLCTGLLALAVHAAPVALTPRDFSDAAQPHVAATPGGRIHVVFGKGHAIYHTSSLDGRAFSLPVKVGALDKLALRMRRGPRLAATDTAIVVTAISHLDGNLHAWTSLDQGATWKEGTRLNEAEHSAREGLHAMAGDGRGFVVAAWLDLRNGGAELWSRVSRDAGATWAQEVRIYASPDGYICQCCHPSLALGAQGEIAALWRNSIGASRDPWMAVSRDRGEHFETASKVGRGTWKLNACPMDGGAIALGPKDTPFSVWRREKAVFLSAADEAEEKLADNAAQPVVVIARGEPIVVWEENGGLKLRRGHGAPTVLAATARAPSLATLPSGAVIAVWESSADGTATLRGELLSR